MCSEDLMHDDSNVGARRRGWVEERQVKSVNGSSSVQGASTFVKLTPVSQQRGGRIVRFYFRLQDWGVVTPRVFVVQSSSLDTDDYGKDYAIRQEDSCGLLSQME
jgi:hypothetical protein